MRQLAHQIGLITLVLSLLFCPAVRAEENPLIHFDLTLAGYRLGMTMDDASAIRPLQFRQAALTNLATAEEASFEAFVDHVYIGSIAFNLWLRFKGDRIQKVVGRFAPEHLMELARTLSLILGPGDDKTRVIVNHAGKETRQTIYLWEYPTARVHLVGIAGNDRYATIGLVAREVVGTEAVATE